MAAAAAAVAATYYTSRVAVNLQHTHQKHTWSFNIEDVPRAKITTDHSTDGRNSVLQHIFCLSVSL